MKFILSAILLVSSLTVSAVEINGSEADAVRASILKTLGKRHQKCPGVYGTLQRIGPDEFTFIEMINNHLNPYNDRVMVFGEAMGSTEIVSIIEDNTGNRIGYPVILEVTTVDSKITTLKIIKEMQRGSVTSFTCNL